MQGSRESSWHPLLMFTVGQQKRVTPQSSLLHMCEMQQYEEKNNFSAGGFMML